MGLPEPELYYIVSTILSNADTKYYIDDNGIDEFYYSWRCDDLNHSTLPSFSLMLDNHWFEVTPDDYIMTDIDDPSICTFCIDQTYSFDSLSFESAVDGTVRLGRRFLEDWYTTFD